MPGVFNWVNTPPINMNDRKTTWVMAIFGQIERGDLRERWSNGISPTNLNEIAPSRVETLVCPSNREMMDAGSLSYMVNMGVYPAVPVANPGFNSRLFRDRTTCSFASNTVLQAEPEFALTSLKTTSKTVMLSECLTAGPWNFVSADPGVCGNYPNPGISKLCFAWTNDPPTPVPTGYDQSTSPSPFLLTSTPAPGLSAYHRGVIVVTFFDGHVEGIPEGASTWRDPENEIFGVP
jgi:prepilin-type processing-associated H-X9-DG protein